MFWIEQFLYINEWDRLALGLTALGFLVLAGLLIINRQRKLVNKNILPGLVFLYLLPIFIGLYAFFIEPNLLMVKGYAFNAPQIELDRPIRLVVIGDMQARARIAPSYVEYVTEKVNQLDADYIIWVGDLIEDTTDDLPLFTPFEGMEAKVGKYAVLGNHDYRDNMTDPVNQQMANDVADKLEIMGFTVLRNQVVSTTIQDQKVVIAGTEDLWSGRVDFGKTNPEVKEAKGDLNLLITHQPLTVVDNPDPDLYALTLAGHCHGGQINLLFLNPLVGFPHLPPGCSRQPGHLIGLFKEAAQQVFVTPGVGSLKVRARLFSPPEISVVQIY